MNLYQTTGLGGYQNGTKGAASVQPLSMKYSYIYTSKPPPDHKENLPAAITQSSNRTTRTGTGPCGFQPRRRGHISTCSCTQGIFSYHPDSGAFEDVCESCGHLSSMHEDINVVGGKSICSFCLSDFF